jgi:D-alanyl-D-alanine carboxypeptidase (penicillin-binding protein 5/6)
MWQRRWLGWCVVALWLAGAMPAAAAGKRQAVRLRPRESQGAAGTYRSAILVEADSGTVLFEEHAHLQMPPASMTKMMLMLLVAEAVRDARLHWQDPVTTSRRASKMGGSQVYLKEGEVFTLAEMMQAVAIHSANDAAAAVAEAVAGSAPVFIASMNERAKELGMRDTVFRSEHGLPPEAGHAPDLSTAYDLALVARELVKFPDILTWSGTKELAFRNGSLLLTNTNRLVRETNWVDGLKTGYYSEAGFNVTATAQRDGMRLIAVIMGAPQKGDCFAAAAGLLNKGFTEFHALAALQQGDVIANDVEVHGGRPRFVRIVAGGSLKVLAKRGQKSNFNLQLSLPRDIEAPLAARQVVGEVVVRDGDTVVGRVPAMAADPVERGTLWDRVF